MGGTYPIASILEPAFGHFFGRVGSFTARAPWTTIAVVCVVLAALTGGNFKIETENNVNDLLIARHGRIAGEKDFYIDNFDLISPVLNSVIVTAKPGVDIFSVEALDEFHALQESIRTYTFEYRPGLNVSLEQFCFKAINRDPTEPCWQSSLLESFREGDVFNVGGELNTDFAVLFAAKPSYKDFNFEEDLSRSFLAKTNLNPDSLLLGKFEVDESQDRITSVGALQIAFGAKSPESLQNDGLQYFEWIEQEAQEGEDGFCPDETKCDACADALNPAQFAASGCTFDGATTQLDSCCEALQVVRDSPCVDVVFERRAELGPVANALFTACDIPIVEISPRCTNQALILGSREISQPPPACTCLTNPTSETCTTALAVFLSENPSQAEIFAAAAGGDIAASQQVTEIIQTEFNCPVAQTPAGTPTSASAQPPATGSQKTYKAKVTVIKEETDTIDKARNLVHEWEKAWRGQMNDVVREYKYIDVVWITSTAIDDDVAAAADADLPLLALGYVLVFIYVLVFCSFEWRLSGITSTQFPPGPSIAALCFFMVLLSVLASMGVAGYVSATSSFKVVFSTIQQIPLLMVGLGVNDFFVLCTALKETLSKRDCPKTVEAVMYDAMSIGGTSISLSSAANAVAFALSSLNPVPIVLWYGIQMSASIILAYIVSITAIPSLLSIAVSRHLEGKRDPIIAWIVSRKEQPKETTDEEDRLNALWTEGPIAQAVRKYRWPLSAAVFAGFAIWMAFGVERMIHFEQGLDLGESVEKHSYTYNYLISTQKYFDVNRVDVVFRDTIDYADPADFQAVRRSEFEFVSEAHRVEKQLTSTSWMEFYTRYVEAKFCSNEICMNEVVWYYDGFSSADFGLPNKNICNGVESAEECRNLCATHCPQGPQGSKFRCQYQKATNACYCPYRPMLKSELFYENPNDFGSRIESYWADFLERSNEGRASRAFVNFESGTATDKNPFGLPQASRSYVFTRGLTAIPHQLRHIDSGRRVLDRQEIDTYPFSYEIYAIGEQYKDLAVQTVKNVGISLAVATIVMAPLLVSIVTACIVSGCVLLSILLTIGTTAMTAINLDFGTYVSFIAAVGLSVEFCAHISRAFMLTSGDRVGRALQALKTMGIAVFNGGVTTFLGILPAAFSYLQIIQDRFFTQFSIVVATGIFIGLLFLPIVLSIIGPEAYEPKIAKETDNKQRKDVEMQQASKDAST